jgi:antitoxin component YwqK of YwqJK toxin-antitoxin module
MEGEWLFNRESGKLWQIGNFLNGEKHGLRIRYNDEGRIGYKAEFANNKLVKRIR